ncbi:MAG: redoxin domain-containing protein [Chitinophagales bacterium]|nr:redoxin domain-containing protein [Chitinophagales bacterium]
MNKLFTLAFAAFISCSAIAGENIKSIDIGTKIPMATAKMRSVDKKEVSFNDAKTQSGLLVMFSCNTCPYVIKSQARTKEMVTYAQKAGLGIVIVNSNEAKRDGDDSYKAMTKYAKDQGYDVPYVVDENSQLADAFGATRTPEVYLFDGNGTLMYKGAMEDNPANPSESTQLFLKDAIDKMTTGMVPDPGTTKSIGCTIKRVS